MPTPQGDITSTQTWDEAPAEVAVEEAAEEAVEEELPGEPDAIQ